MEINGIEVHFEGDMWHAEERAIELLLHFTERSPEEHLSDTEDQFRLRPGCRILPVPVRAGGARAIPRPDGQRRACPRRRLGAAHEARG